MIAPFNWLAHWFVKLLRQRRRRSRPLVKRSPRFVRPHLERLEEIIALSGNAPAAVDDAATAHQGQEILVNVRANDGPGAANANPVLETTPQHGNAYFDGDGLLRYQSHPGHAGVEQLAYRLWIDNDSSNLAAIHITVSNVSTWTGLGDGITWSDAENWSDNATPGPYDNIVIGAGAIVNADTITLTAGHTLTVNGHLDVQNLQLNGGTLNGSGTVTIHQTLDFTSGVMAGTGITNLAAGATGTITQTPGSSTAPALAESRTLVIVGELTWQNAFAIAPTAGIINHSGLRFYACTFAYDAATPITNNGTLSFENSFVTFTGPLTIPGQVRVLSSDYWTQDNLTIHANVTFTNLHMIAGGLTGPGILTITNRFNWEGGTLTGDGALVVGATGALELPPTYWRFLSGRSLNVLGERILQPSRAPFDKYDGIAILEPANPSGGYILDNYGIRAPAGTGAGATFGIEQADALAHQIYEAMYGGLVGAGVDAEAVYQALQNRSQAQIADIEAAYSSRFSRPGTPRQMRDDLNSQWQFTLFSLESARLAELLAGNQPGADAIAIRGSLTSNHEGWSWGYLEAREILYRGNTALIAQEYARLFPLEQKLVFSQAESPPATFEGERLLYDFHAATLHGESRRTTEHNQTNPSQPLPANLISDLQDYRLSVAVMLQGNRVASDALVLHGILTSGHSSLPWAAGTERVFALLQSANRAHYDAVHAEYLTRFGADLKDAIRARMNGSEKDRLDAWLSGDRYAVIAATLRAAFDQDHDGSITDSDGTDEDAVWRQLDGLRADERAMVAQVYRQRYTSTLLQDIHQEFSNNMFDGPELEKTLQLMWHGGLSVAQRIYFATEGRGTDENEIRRAMGELRRMTPAEVQAAHEEYGRLVPLVPTYDDEGHIILGQPRRATLQDAFNDDLSGSFRNDATLSLEGRLTTVEQYYQLALRRYNYERVGASNWLGNFISGINDQGERLEATWQRIQTAYQAIPQANRNESIDNHVDFRRVMRQLDHDVEAYRGFRSAAAEVAANGLATIAGVAAFTFTGGAIAPIIVAFAAGASTQAAARMAVEGHFTWEELPADLFLGGVNGVFAGLSLPQAPGAVGSRFYALRAAAGNPFANGAFATGLSTLVREDTWSQGFAVGFVTVGQAAALGGIGGLGAQTLSRVPGAAVSFARSSGLTTMTRTIATQTGRTVVNLFDASFVGAVRLAAGVREGIESVLTPQRISDIAAFLHHGFAGNQLTALRNQLRDLLSDLPPLRLNFAVEAGAGLFESSRQEFENLAEAGIRTRLIDRMHAMYVSMSDAVDALLGRLPANTEREGAERLAQELAQAIDAIENGDQNAIRQAVQAALPAQADNLPVIASIRNLLIVKSLDGSNPALRALGEQLANRAKQLYALLTRSEMEKTTIAVSRIRVDEVWVEVVTVNSGAPQSVVDKIRPLVVGEGGIFERATQSGARGHAEVFLHSRFSSRDSFEAIGVSHMDGPCSECRPILRDLPFSNVFWDSTRIAPAP